jgi:hypothetical protein
MPASIFRTDLPVAARVLITFQRVEPDATEPGSVEEEVDFLGVVERLRVEVAVSCFTRIP